MDRPGDDRPAVLTSVTPIVASAALPFDREGGETLEFMHAQAKVSFRAKLADDMTKAVGQVRITLGSDLVATGLEWLRGENHYHYHASSGEGAVSYTIAQSGDDLLSQENPVDIGWAYIVPPNTDAIQATITVNRADAAGAVGKDVTFHATLPFSIERDSENPDDREHGQLKAENILYANEAYTFTLVFGEESIELLGNKCPWEEGGYLIVPVYPLDKNE